jgi:hypothetical protein
MNTDRLWIPSVDAPRNVDPVVRTKHGQAKHSRNRRDSIVCESDHQTVRSVPLEGPDKRRADADRSPAVARPISRHISSRCAEA